MQNNNAEVRKFVRSGDGKLDSNCLSFHLHLLMCLPPPPQKKKKKEKDKNGYAHATSFES